MPVIHRIQTNPIKHLKKQVLSSIYVRSKSQTHLPQNLYVATANQLKIGLYKGYGDPLLKYAYDSPDYKMLYELRTNVYMFSAAKTFQQTLAMSEELTEGDKFRSFEEFSEKAGKIFDTFNEQYLEAEYNTAIGMARSASKWADIEKNKNLFPFLKYVAVMDEHTCDICAPLDGITLPADDPFWDENMPLNHFNCECTVEQLEEDEAEETNEEYVDSKVADSHENKNPLFNMNPGKHKAVFKDTGKTKHPYFEVSKAYKDLAKRNFDLPIPETDN
jgi:SPP1 gp7 family putative phage head morphogenesis protein